MNHQPTQLALLISLIGVAPYAQARVDAHPLDAAQTLPGVSCSEAEAAALPLCGNAANELVWQPPRSTLELGGTAGVRVLYTSRDDWAPGETPLPPDGLGRWQPRASVDAPKAKSRKQAAAAAAAADASEAPKPRKSGKTRRLRAVAANESGAKAVDAAALERIAPVALVAVVEVPKAAEPAPAAKPASTEIDRLLDNLAVVLRESPTHVSGRVDLALPLAEPAEPAEIVPSVARLRDASPAQLTRAEVVVESQSSKVLRSLDTILSEPRDAVAASRPAATPAVVTSQTDKVMAMLGEVSSAEPPLVEDGPAKRLRKLAARAAKVEAKAAAEALQNGIVDLMLPLEMPTFSALPPETLVNAAPLMEPAALPMSVTPTVSAERTPERAKRANPFGDRQVAVNESSLDRVRGGFAGEGLNISFGIERAVYINGSLVTTTTMNVTDLGQIAAGRAGATLDAGTIALIQNGMGNRVSPGTFSATSAGTVIQNTLDNQKIQNITTINATVNSLGLLRNIDLGSSLRGAVIDSLRR